MAADVLTALRALAGIEPVLRALAGRDDVWVVGGAVRDALLGRPPKDLDLVVEGDAGELAAELGEVEETHDRFGTFSVACGAARVNLATARTERYPTPGALPEVAPSSLEHDLARRDFTVNALAVDLAGRLHAPAGAQEDLAAGRLRVLHPGSFLDDPTRLWRLARYAARLGFAVEHETERLARAAVEAGAPATVSGPRLGNELRLSLEEPDPEAALAAAHELGLLPSGVRPRRALSEAALGVLPADGGRGLVTLAAMASGLAPSRLRAWLDELGVPARERDAVLAAVEQAESLAAALSAASRPSEIAAAARRAPAEAVALAGALGPLDEARAWLDDLRHVRLEITGDDLLAAGVTAGPELGRRLERALAARLDGEARGRDAELAAALA